MSRIAIVEDNAVVRASLVELVNSIPGCECAGDFDCGEDALRLIPRIQPDLVMMDIHLPNLSGIETTRVLKEMMPSLAVLILTVYEDEEKIFQALRAGASGYILKRSRPQDIVGAVREMLGGGAPMTPAVARKVVDSFSRSLGGGPDEESLSRRETEILRGLTRGLSNKEIAEELGVALETVRWHLKQIYDKFHVHSRTEAAVKYLQLQETKREPFP
jgi:DNA-binding NarL/FixJ family response regulator